jgi:hypothetical protein
MITEYTVERETWLRGKGPAMANSGLLKNGKRCCLGFVCAQLGIPDDVMKYVGMPYGLPRELRDPIPELRLFAGDTHYGNGAFAYGAAQINDDPCITDEEREEKLIALFAEQGLTLKFV